MRRKARQEWEGEQRGGSGLGRWSRQELEGSWGRTWVDVSMQFEVVLPPEELLTHLALEPAPAAMCGQVTPQVAFTRKHLTEEINQFQVWLTSPCHLLSSPTFPTFLYGNNSFSAYLGSEPTVSGIALRTSWFPLLTRKSSQNMPALSFCSGWCFFSTQRAFLSYPDKRLFILQGPTQVSLLLEALSDSTLPHQANQIPPLNIHLHF